MFFQEFCYETHRLIQKRWESAKTFLFLRSQMKPCLFSKCFEKHFVKTHWLIFFVPRDADFLSSKLLRNSLEEKFCS